VQYDRNKNAKRQSVYRKEALTRRSTYQWRIREKAAGESLTEVDRVRMQECCMVSGGEVASEL